MIFDGKDNEPLVTKVSVTGMMLSVPMSNSKVFEANEKILKLAMMQDDWEFGEPLPDFVKIEKGNLSALSNRKLVAEMLQANKAPGESVTEEEVERKREELIDRFNRRLQKQLDEEIAKDPEWAIELGLIN